MYFLRTVRRFSFVLCGLLLVGCSSNKDAMPKVYSVKGTVVTTKGEPYQGGSLQFRPDSKEDITVVGQIEKDGTFHLRTIKGSTGADGAPPGTYEVTISAPQGQDQKTAFNPFVVPKKFQIEPKDTELEIKTDPPKR